MKTITEKDCIVDIEGFPVEVVQKMVERQIEQGNKENVTVFQKWRLHNKIDGGFDWGETTEGGDFWKNITYDRDFSLFFEKYPKTKSENTLQQAQSEKSKQIDWEQRRYELAKAAMQGLVANITLNQYYDAIANMSLYHADEMIKQLKT